MAKRSRRPVRGDASTTRPAASPPADVRTGAPGDRSTRRARTRRVRQQSLLDRYRSWIITGAAAVGILIVGFVFFQGASTAAYTCSSQLTPGPVESLTPRPSVLATPTPAPTTTPVATTAATGSPSASGTPAASGSPQASESPQASVAASPAASESPAASPSAQPTPAPEPTARLGFTTDILGQSHVRNPNESINYGFCPPTSGEHINSPPRGPIPAQFYGPTEEKTPGGWVHNLEHGFVVLLYRCPSGIAGSGDCPTQAELDQLRAWFDQAPANTVAASCPKKVLVARFDSMTTKFALVAWGRALLMDQFDLDTALTFAQQWMEHEAVPERTVC